MLKKGGLIKSTKGKKNNNCTSFESTESRAEIGYLKIRQGDKADDESLKVVFFYQSFKITKIFFISNFSRQIIKHHGPLVVGCFSASFSCYFG